MLRYGQDHSYLPPSPLRSWQVYLDLQCPFSKAAFFKLPELRRRFGSEFQISVHYTSLPFHPQAFPAQSAAAMVGETLGPAAREAFEAAVFEHQETIMNSALGDCRKSEVDGALAAIAGRAGIGMSREDFLAKMHDWKGAVMPAWVEMKAGMAAGVTGTPGHVVDGELVTGTESSWGADEWAAKLATL